MNFREYQKEVKKLDIYPEGKEGILARFLGLAEETGEVCSIMNKYIRDAGTNKALSRKKIEINLKKELGDVLFLLTDCIEICKFELDEVAKINLKKLKRRMKRNTLHGNGDER